LPQCEVRRVETRDEAGVETRMEALAELADGAGAQASLLPLVAAYGAWIGAQRGVAVDSGERRETRDVLCKRADEACARIREGIELLAMDAEVFEAFRLANRAMAMAARQRSPGRYEGDVAPSWRLFQLAFVLMNLPALADPTHAARDVVDLIFFPTGGGKTEAYLGVIAVTLVLRRIRARARADGGLGVAVLLRYTLRLLTLDQLSRAATLVGALEPAGRAGAPRRRASRGLWVGRSRPRTPEGGSTRYKTGRRRRAVPAHALPWCGRSSAHSLGSPRTQARPSP
jgi:hypothetical protein